MKNYFVQEQRRCHFERQNGEKRRGISISPEPLKPTSQGRNHLKVTL